MIDYTGFDSYQEEGLLRPCDVNVLREKLEDIVDRLYSEDHEIDNDEVDLSIRKMADILGVYVPKNTLEVKLGNARFEYMEDIINEHYYDNFINVLYSSSYPNAAFGILVQMKMDKKIEALSIGDLADFCFSDFFQKRCKEYKNV